MNVKPILSNGYGVSEAEGTSAVLPDAPANSGDMIAPPAAPPTIAGAPRVARPGAHPFGPSLGMGHGTRSPAVAPGKFPLNLKFFSTRK
jgi:hypothetical protein